MEAPLVKRSSSRLARVISSAATVSTTIGWKKTVTSRRAAAYVEFGSTQAGADHQAGQNRPACRSPDLRRQRPAFRATRSGRASARNATPSLSRQPRHCVAHSAPAAKVAQARRLRRPRRTGARPMMSATLSRLARTQADMRTHADFALHPSPETAGRSRRGSGKTSPARRRWSTVAPSPPEQTAAKPTPHRR